MLAFIDIGEGILGSFTTEEGDDPNDNHFGAYDLCIELSATVYLRSRIA